MNNTLWSVAFAVITFINIPDKVFFLKDYRLQGNYIVNESESPVKCYFKYRELKVKGTFFFVVEPGTRSKAYKRPRSVLCESFKWEDE